VVKIAVLGDSHIASGGLPNGCLLNMVKVGGFDLLVHVGDLSNEQVLKELEGIGKLVVVAGETDPMPLPDKEIIDVEGVRLLVIHGHQKEARLHLRRMVNYFNARLVLMGHTHRPMVQDLGGVLVVKPRFLYGFQWVPVKPWPSWSLPVGALTLGFRGVGGLTSISTVT
jgi:phosphoesterase, MJ0936 family